jgi:hypothetical protein
MARKPSYDHLSIVGTVADRAAEPAQVSIPESGAGEGAQPAQSHLLTHRTAHVMLYMHPEAQKTLARYAVEKSSFRQKVKVHDFLMEAVEDFFEKNGLPARFG